jgi:hypothetical protein
VGFFIAGFWVIADAAFLAVLLDFNRLSDNSRHLILFADVKAAGSGGGIGGREGAADTVF